MTTLQFATFMIAPVGALLIAGILSTRRGTIRRDVIRIQANDRVQSAMATSASGS